jgi:hypothetical protein
MALSDQIDFPAFFRLWKDDLPEFNKFCNMTIRCHLFPVRWPYAAVFKKVDFPELETAENQCKCHREHDGQLQIAP